MELKDEAKQRESFGIEILLSQSPNATVTERKRQFTPKVQWVKKSAPIPEKAVSAGTPKKTTSETTESTASNSSVPIKPEIKVKIPKEVATGNAVSNTTEKENQTNNSSHQRRDRGKTSSRDEPRASTSTEQKYG
jgi:hypothetical protein